MSKAKRKTPDKDTLRELYLKSGNQCAFPECTRVMLSKDGAFVGQICHIEAAEEGGERFNAAMSDEERAAFSNLMLMCYEHHVITNDVNAYPVPVLQSIKAGHEAKFTDPAQAILDGDASQLVGNVVQIGTTNRAVTAPNSGTINMGDSHHYHHHPGQPTREADTAASLLTWLLVNVPSKDLSETLPVALRLAHKLGDRDFEKWVRLEFNGYNAADKNDTDSVPEYRNVSGRYVDQYKRMAPHDPDIPSMNIFRFKIGVRELERYAASDKELNIQDPDIISMIRETLKFDAVRFVSNPAAILSVLDAIRSRLLDRLHKIEAGQESAVLKEGAPQAPRSENYTKKWGCYMFEGDSEMYCPGCYSRGRKSPATRLNSRYQQCTVCKVKLG